MPFLTKPAQNLTAAIQTRLWNLIQHRLFDRRAACKLKPLQIPAADQHRASDEMLDNGEPQTAFQMFDEPFLSSDQGEMLDGGLGNEDDEDKMLFSKDEDEMLFSEDEDGMLFSEDEDEMLFSEDEDDDELLNSLERGLVKYPVATNKGSNANP